MPYDITDEKVRSVIGQYGLVAQVKVLPPFPGRSDREAFVRMSKSDDAKWIVENVHDNVLEGMTNPVVVKYSLHKGPLSPWGGLPVASTAAAAIPAPLAVVPPAARGVPLGIVLSGTVRRWDAAKGFGFIGPDAGGPDVFVHVRELTDGEMLVPGSKVMFEAMLDQARGPGKYRAKMCLGAKPKVAAPSEVVSDKLYVSGLPLDITEDMISSVFSQYGTLLSVRKVPQVPGKSDASAVVHMGDVSQAKWLAENVNGNIPVGMSTPVIVTYAEHTAPQAIALLATANAGYGKALPLPMVPPQALHSTTPTPGAGTVGQGVFLSNTAVGPY